STWWEPELAAKSQSDPSYTSIDVGKFNPLLGKSYAEIASISRSMHKSQGFGTELARGSRIEYLQLIKGEKIKNDPFENIDCGWSRVSNGKEIGKKLNEAYALFSLENPSVIVPKLLEVKALIEKLPDEHWRTVKLKEIERLILACAGIWLEASSAEENVAGNDDILITTEIVNRSDVNVVLKRLSVNGKDTTMSMQLINNELIDFKNNVQAPDYRLTNPYWLNATYDGMFKVDEATL